jgi:hypothetical protein
MRRCSSAPTLYHSDLDTGLTGLEAERPVTLETELALVPNAATKKLKMWTKVIDAGLKLESLPTFVADPIIYEAFGTRTPGQDFTMCFMVNFKVVPGTAMLFPDRCHSTILRLATYPGQTEVTAKQLQSRPGLMLSTWNLLLQAQFTSMVGSKFVSDDGWGGWTMGLCRPLYTIMEGLVSMIFSWCEAAGLIGRNPGRSPMYVKELREFHISWE